MEAGYLAVLKLLPWLPEEPVASFRRTYDPTAQVVKPHITLVFPVPDSISIDLFREHVRRVISRTPSFRIRLNGFEKAWDHWLFLLVAEGNDKIIALHDELYAGILRPYLWTEHPFIPHVGLGLFVEEGESHDLFKVRPCAFDRIRFDRALTEARALHLDYSGPFDSVHIVELDEALTHVTPLEEIRLQAATSLER